MTVDGLGCLIWWELGFQPEIVDLRINKKKIGCCKNFSGPRLVTVLDALCSVTKRVRFKNLL